MKTFIDENFLLTNDIAKTLYHDYAKNMPIIDYHCHLDPKAIAENKKFGSITEIWLGGDHYKWRALRTFGIDEKFITGDSTDEEKFQKWAEVLPYTIGNPLSHWSALELKTYFGVDDLLTEDNWESIYRQCNEQLQTDDFSTQSLIEKSNVEWICTTDDPIDTLEYHDKIKEQSNFKTKVTPTFRPDKILLIQSETFLAYVEQLEKVVGFKIDSYKKMLEAAINRADYFNSKGCFISDHAFGNIPFELADEQELEQIFSRKLAGIALTQQEADKYTTCLFIEIAKHFHKLNWAIQLHIGAIRNPNTRMFNLLGADTGYDFIGDYCVAENLAKLLNALDSTDQLPKTILYTLNSNLNDVLGTLIASFQQGGIKAKIQFGTAWWFNDQKDGMSKQMLSLSNLGLLSCFIGMLTDSRSFLSYTRHEYFRRILCNLIGTWVINGEVQNDINFLGQIVKDICYNNAKNYFNI